MKKLGEEKLLYCIKEDNVEIFRKMLNKSDDASVWDQDFSFSITDAVAAYGAGKIAMLIRKHNFHQLKSIASFEKKIDFDANHQLILASISGDLKAIIAIEQTGVDFHFYNSLYFYQSVINHHHETALYLFHKNISLIQRQPCLLVHLVSALLEHESEWQFDDDMQTELRKLKEDILFLLKLGFDIKAVDEQRGKTQTALDAALDWLHWANPYAGEIVLFLAAHGGLTHAEIQQPELLSRDSLRQRRQACLHQASLACTAFYQGCQASLDRSWAQHLPSQATSIENLLLAQNALSYEAKMLNQRLQNWSKPGSVLSSEAEELYLQLEQLQQQRLGPLKQLLEKTVQDADLPHFWRFLIQACPPKAQAPGRLMRYKEILAAGLHIEAEVQQVLQRFSQC